MNAGAPQRVVITGASDGIGAALARAYAARGATLGLVARRGDRLQALADTLGVTAALYPVDVRDSAAMARMAADFLARFGPPDVVIANAGVSAGTAPELAEDLDTTRWIFEVNVIGLAATLQPFVEPMRSRGGRLVGVASVAGIRGLPGSGAYCASKSAAITYLESLRVDLHGTPLRVVTLCPGYIRTAMTARNPYRMPFLLDADEAARRFLRVIDAGRARAVVPWQMAIVAKLLRTLPAAWFDRLFAGAKRKPRRSELEA